MYLKLSLLLLSLSGSLSVSIRECRRTCFLRDASDYCQRGDVWSEDVKAASVSRRTPLVILASGLLSACKVRPVVNHSLSVMFLSESDKVLFWWRGGAVVGKRDLNCTVRSWEVRSMCATVSDLCCRWDLWGCKKTDNQSASNPQCPHFFFFFTMIPQIWFKHLWQIWIGRLIVDCLTINSFLFFKMASVQHCSKLLANVNKINKNN